MNRKKLTKKQLGYTLYIVTCKNLIFDCSEPGILKHIMSQMAVQEHGTATDRALDSSKNAYSHVNARSHA
jgi:hypothetical protein